MGGNGRLGGSGMVFTIVHIATSYLNGDAGFDVASLFVPGAASVERLALAWGVVATYLFLTAMFTAGAQPGNSSFTTAA